MNRLSIRWRLTLWNTVALAVLLVAIGSLIYALLRHAMYEQLDRVLADQYRELQHNDRLAADPESRLRHWLDEFQSHVGVYGVVYRSSGDIYCRTEQLAQQSLPAPPGEVANAPEFESRKLPLIGRQRTMTSSLGVGDERFVVMLMLPLEETDRELHQVATVLLGVLPFSLVLAGAVGYVLARKALAPVDQLRRAADQITAERLSQRLDVPNPNDELGRLGRTINAMIARLERSFAEIRRFTADASHELRTPISVIRTEAEVAMKNPPDAEQYRSLASSILEECDLLAKLTDQLLTLSREDAGVNALDLERLDLSQIITEAAEVMRPLAEAKRQTLSVVVANGLCVTGDANRLRQVVYNLLDNAIKYTPQGSRVTVEADRQDDAISVMVHDTGIGIGAAHLPQVFDRFYRVDKARSREEGGTGLGLSIVDSIVAAHSGRVTITSTPGEGTTFTVTLPETGSSGSGS